MSDFSMTVASQFVPTENARILVVDDDPILREFAGVYLTSPTMEVEVAEDGHAALNRLKKGGIDIALVDLEMPVMDGFELIAAVRAEPGLEDLPIVVITGREDMEAIDRAYGTGATSFAIKPLNWRLVSHQLAYVLRNSRADAKQRQGRRLAEQSDGLKTNILRLMRHEFNTPFNVILGFGRLIEGHSDNPAVQGHARQILMAAEKFKRMHDQLMESARILSGDIEVTKKVFSIADLIKAAAREALRVGGKSTDLKLADRTGNTEITGDYELLLTALRNLIENAFAHGQAPIHVTGQRTANGRVAIRVSDAGKGMDQTSFALAIEAFKQGKNALQRTEDGLGLGLATAAGSMKAVGGEIHLVNDEDVGFGIEMEFPLEMN
ncbi:MAG: hybrid sensor histidine kinase/response regulator [Aquidulcibacter sp.]|jgi:signal transduction histidine kinase|nr:hybrid sensor histidine kinase/response regulator [Hyphomonadaceae bacterium]MCZ8210159.1 hybrid sensor histidine kinase/response regulator [Aquidulcibacter sp.]